MDWVEYVNFIHQRIPQKEIEEQFMTTNAQGVFHGKNSLILELEPLAEYINNATGAEKQLNMVEKEEN